MDRASAIGNRPRGRIFYGWWIVLAAMVGLSTGPSQFAFSSLGLFMDPLREEFGWDRAQISLALTFFTASLALCLPLVGRLTDRIGSRRVVVPAMVVCGLCLVAIPLTIRELWHLLLIFALLGSLGAGANNLPFMRTISAWFDRRRGLAIGLAMAGGGLSFAYVPPLVTFVIDAYGWRSAYAVLAAIVLFIAVPLVGLVFRDSPAEKGLSADGDPVGAGHAETTSNAGLNLKQSLKTNRFWILWVIFCVLSFSLYGLLPHVVPMLTDRGMTASSAAFAASMIGITVIIARVGIGYLIDHFFAPKIALLFFLLSAVGIGLLATGATGALAFLATLSIGLSIGAEIDLLAYLTGRYFGLAHFGAVYGVMFAALLVGTSAGPVSYGAAFEAMGSYTGILLVCAGLNVLVSFLLILLPPYPDF